MYYQKLELSAANEIKQSFHACKNLSNLLEKIICNEKLNYAENECLLEIALLLQNRFTQTNLITYFELAYYLILKYALSTQDYRPLFDLSINSGFYPITEYLLTTEQYKCSSLKDFITLLPLEKYKREEPYSNNRYTETFEQHQNRITLLKNQYEKICFIAPTSYGKSSTILEHIELNSKSKDKIGIIVPTKSLLNQTYQNVKKANLDYKIILHDESLNEKEDHRFIAIVTQERALRILEKTYFDVLYIDEAHKVYANGSREYLLARFIKQSFSKNNNTKYIFLSPFISDPTNLSFIEDSKATSLLRINFSMKEPELLIYDKSKLYRYNRFTQEKYYIEKFETLNELIKNKAIGKTLIFHNKPQQIESYAKQLCDVLPTIPMSKALKTTIEAIKEHVHNDIFFIQCLKKGIVYLHAKYPEPIKDYLEEKFKTVKELKYLIANQVILEGINLPIETMFINNIRGLKKTGILNLIGRVNRLNNVFDKQNGNLAKLLPQIYFCTNASNKLSTVENALEELRVSPTKDIINNPLINTCKDNIKNKYKNIIEEERLLDLPPKTPNEALHKELVKFGLSQYFDITDDFLNKLSAKIQFVKTDSEQRRSDIINKFKFTFIDELHDNINNHEPYLNYLKYSKSIDYLKNYLKIRTIPLKQQIQITYDYIEKRNNPILYVGTSFGEVDKEGKRQDKNNLYIDLTKKSKVDKLNYAILQIRREQDFISFTLSNFVSFMFAQELITEDEYNKFMYNTSDPSRINYIRHGFSLELIEFLMSQKQLHNLEFDKYKNLSANQNFKKFLNKQDDYIRFRINRLI